MEQKTLFSDFTENFTAFWEDQFTYSRCLRIPRKKEKYKWKCHCQTTKTI